ncbi:MAG: hypothetical protein IPK32_13030 [Verrucomicrobiaceae bacterium]|nr:hypothetical protein [Verrucomicrobiaceae bacterium]
MNDSPTCPAWKIWANPIIRRYCRSRLRPQGLALWLILTLILSGFVFFISRTVSMYRGGMLPVDAERVPLIPLLIIQAFILFFMGVGQAVSGIITEADEGVMDYQRLQPMSPLAKVVGFWLGLPVREWLLFASTLPFTAWGLYHGQVPLRAWASIYGVLITTALMYHVTALAAGMVIKNRRSATLVSMFVIAMLYTGMPQIAQAGLIFFEYLTVRPVVMENWHFFMPRDAGGVAKVLRELDPQVKFFGLEFDSIVFTLVCQGGIMLTFGTMVWRRWCRAESHLLGKAWAVALFIWVQVLLLGNALPLIEPGSIFPTRAFMSRFQWGKLLDPTLREAVIMIGLYGIISLLIMLVLVFIITPALDVQWRGLRQAKKLSLPRVPRLRDAASSLPFVLMMITTAAVSWNIFAQAIMDSKWFPGHSLPAYAPLVFLLVLANPVLAYYAVLEGWGGRRLFLCVLFIGVVPVLIGTIVGSANNGLLPLATWLNAISPAYGPIAAPTVMVPGTDLPLPVKRAVPLSFAFFQGITSLLTVWLLLRLRAIHRARRASVEQDGGSK